MSTFAELLVKAIGNKKHSLIYNSCDLSASSFSDLYSEKYFYRENVIKLCFGLNLNLIESNALMKEAGFAFTSSKRDEIIQFWLGKENAFQNVNLALYENNQKLLMKS